MAFIAQRVGDSFAWVIGGALQRALDADWLTGCVGSECLITMLPGPAAAVVEEV